jgi:hypothetical protein
MSYLRCSYVTMVPWQTTPHHSVYCPWHWSGIEAQLLSMESVLALGTSFTSCSPLRAGQLEAACGMLFSKALALSGLALPLFHSHPSSTVCMLCHICTCLPLPAVLSALQSFAGLMLLREDLPPSTCNPPFLSQHPPHVWNTVNVPVMEPSEGQGLRGSLVSDHCRFCQFSSNFL